MEEKRNRRCRDWGSWTCFGYSEMEHQTDCWLKTLRSMRSCCLWFEEHQFVISRLSSSSCHLCPHTWQKVDSSHPSTLCCYCFASSIVFVSFRLRCHSNSDICSNQICFGIASLTVDGDESCCLTSRLGWCRLHEAKHVCYEHLSALSLLINYCSCRY